METENAIDGTFWDNRWKNNQTGWDLGQVSTPIAEFINTLTNPNISILIPGCGNAYEALYLAKKGFKNITVIDISPTLISQLKTQVNDTRIKLICGDFFTHQGKYDLIIEQTFFCAISPNLRYAYAYKMRELLNKGGILTGLLFNRTFEGGPPFGGNTEEYKTYFEPLFKQVTFTQATNSVKPRLGTEVWLEAVK